MSQTVFERVGIPPEIASAFHLTQRVAQAETDYRIGVQPAVHEEDLVKAHNNLAKALLLPEWGYTNQTEVRKLRMQFMARYPGLLANQAPPDEKGHLSILSADLSPAEATFLATTLLYQKLYNSQYQLTETERASSGNATLSKVVFQQRMTSLYNVFHGQSDTVSIFDIARAIDGFFSDLKMSNSVRSEFGTMQVVNTVYSGKEGR